MLRALSLCTCRRQYPGAAAGRNPRSSLPAVSAFPDSAVGSACTSTFSGLARRSLALRPAHSRGHQVVTAVRRLQPFRYLHDCSDCFRLERNRRVGLPTTGKRRLSTAHAVSGHCRDLDPNAARGFNRGANPARSLLRLSLSSPPKAALPPVHSWSRARCSGHRARGKTRQTCLTSTIWPL